VLVRCGAEPVRVFAIIDSDENSIPEKRPSGVELSIAGAEANTDENSIPRDSAICEYSDRLLGPVYIRYSGRDSQSPETLIQG